jgi:hypothetical protein
MAVICSETKKREGYVEDAKVIIASCHVQPKLH